MSYIVSIANVRSECQINANVEDRKLTVGLNLAHVWFEQRIGRSCYDAFLAAIVADPPLDDVGNEKWLALLPYAKPFICWVAYFHSLPRLHSEPDREGVFTKSGLDYQTVDGRTLGVHERTTKDAYQLYETRLMQFLKDNATTYTCLTQGLHPPTVRTDQTFPGGIIAVPSTRGLTTNEQGGECEDCPDPTYQI